jgi:hypothetical protein
MIISLGLKTYKLKGFLSLLFKKQPCFGNKSGIRMILSHQKEKVLSAIEADYEGLGV